MAVALQIILSFGHTHRSEGFLPGAQWSQTVAAGPARTIIERGDPASKTTGFAFEYCAICATIKMGAAVVPPEAPAWGVPVLVGGVRFAPLAEAAAWTFEHLLFQARAPPAA